MYLPAHFAETRQNELHRILREHPLGVLIDHSSAGLDAEHIPFDFVPSTDGNGGLLRGHVARANTVWQRCPTGTQVMVVFRAAEAYISPNWYPSKHETHRLVPTWNYQVVHVHGTMKVLDDEKSVRNIVALLTHRHESTEAKPWKMGDSEPEFIKGMLQNIVGIEIAITSMVGKSKLSQNRETRDRLNACDVLDSRGQTELGQAMRTSV